MTEKNNSNESLIKLLSRLTRLLDLQQDLPFKWDQSGGKFVAKSEDYWFARQWGKYCFVAGFYGALLLQLGLIRERLTLPQILQAGFYSTGYVGLGYIGYRQIRRRNGENTAALLNGMMRFEKQHQQDSLAGLVVESGWENAGVNRRPYKVLMKLFALTAFCLPILGFFGYLRKPCAFHQPGFFLLAKCNTPESPMIPATSFLRNVVSPLPHLVTVLFLALARFTAISMMLTTIMMQIIVSGIVMPCCIHSYLRVISRKCGLVKARGTGSSGMVMETAGDSQLVRDLCRLLREFQVVVQHYNFAHDGDNTYLLLHCVLVQILGFYPILNLRDVIPPEKLAIYGVPGCDAVFVILVVYGLLGELHGESKKGSLEVLRSAELFMRRRVNRLFLRSVPATKITVGGANFVEKVTPLNCQNWAMLRLVDLTLLKASRH